MGARLADLAGDAPEVRERARPVAEGGLDVAALTDRLGEALVRDRKVVLWTGPLAAATEFVALLRGYGARPPLVIATGEGTGPVPDPATCTILRLDLEPITTMSGDLQREMQLVADPPAAVLEALARYDPDGSAVCLTGFFATARTLAGRPILDGRLSSWAELEDKTRADELCDAAGVPRLPSMVVEVDLATMRRAAAEIDQGAGTVWAGDAAEGVNGAAELVRRLGLSQDPKSIIDFYAAHCRRVRVTPYAEGIPCSIHGLVAPDGTAVLRPVEMMMLRGPGADRFTYAGGSTFWDPPEADRAAMRSYAGRMGQHLAGQVGYRGGFSLDGILTVDGFVVTEINPRFSGGLGVISRALPALPLRLVQTALVSGIDLGVPVTALETALVDAADATRFGIAMGHCAWAPESTLELPVVRNGAGALRPAGPGEEPIATVLFGPAPGGGMVRLVLTPDLVPVGASGAGCAAAACRLADETWGTGLGDLRPAVAVRSYR